MRYYRKAFLFIVIMWAYACIGLFGFILLLIGVDLVHRSKRRRQPEFGKIDAPTKKRVALAHARSERVSALVTSAWAFPPASGPVVAAMLLAAIAIRRTALKSYRATVIVRKR